MLALTHKVTVQVRSSGSEPTVTETYTVAQLNAIFGKGYVEELLEGWEVRHTSKPHLKFQVVSF